MAHMRPALLEVDPQNDFCPGGSLAVKDGDKVVEPLNKMAREFDKNHWPTFYSRCWHLEYTRHFAKYGGRWPVHGIMGTKGAQFHPDLWIPKGAYILNKGVDPSTDAYSAFEGRAFACTFDELLRQLKVNELYIGGLATDYCVKNSVLDALKKDYLKKVYLLTDACRAVDLNPGDGDRAIEEMRGAGAILTTTDEVLK